MKSIIRESTAMVILTMAIMLILITLFFDYIKENTEVVTAETYEISAEERNIIVEKQQYMDSQNTIVLSASYSLSKEELENFKRDNAYRTGQENPFNEVIITDLLHGEDGTTKYQLTETKKSNKEKGGVTNSTDDGNRNTTNNTNTNSTGGIISEKDKQAIKNDIAQPSEGSGSVVNETK